MDEVRDDRWVQLVNLTSDEHRSDSEELKVNNWCFYAAEVTIYEAYSSLHRFRQQFELDLDNHKPINEDFTILWSQIRLHIEVIMGSVRLIWLNLSFEQVLVYVLDVVALGQQVALRHPHVTYDVLSGQREDFVGIAVGSGVSLASANQFLGE